MKTRIMLVDARPIRCAQIANRLRVASDIEVVATAVSARQAERLCTDAGVDMAVISDRAAQGPDFDRLKARLLAGGVRILPFPRLEARGSTDTDLVGSGGSSPSGTEGGAEALAHALAGAISAASQGLPRPERESPLSRPPIVCIGASTGGLPVLQQILEAYPADGPPTVIVQHIRGEFSAGVAVRLDRTCKVEVMEAFPGAPLRPGLAYLAPGDQTHLELRGRVAPVCHLVSGAKVSGHRPSVDALFRSAARQAAPALIGVLLTGMGRDGAEGLLQIRRQGGSTIVQDSATSTVYGMPRAAVELGAAQRILPAQGIAEAILALCAQAKDPTAEIAR